MKKYALICIIIFIVLYRIYTFLGTYDPELSSPETLTWFDTHLPGLSSFTLRIRNHVFSKAYEYFPSPSAELLLGMTVGIDNLKRVAVFKEALKNTGTIHVVVVSGFNIALVQNLILRILGSVYKRKNLVIALLATLFYAFLSGFEPPVIRAWVMGTFAGVGKHLGRSISAMQLLIVSALILLLFNPSFIVSLSFQLSFLATLGLLMFSDIFKAIFRRFISDKSFLFEDLTATFSAQVTVLPLLSYTFGQISLIGFLVNPLILWTVPLATILGGIFILLSYIPFLPDFIMILVTFICQPFLGLFSDIVMLFSRLDFMVLSYKFTLNQLLLSYVILLLIYLRFRTRGGESNVS